MSFLLLGLLAGGLGVRECVATAAFVAESVPVRGVVMPHPEWGVTRFEARWTGPDGRPHTQRFRDRTLFFGLRPGEAVALRVAPRAPGVARRDGLVSLYRDGAFATFCGLGFGAIGVAILWLGRRASPVAHAHERKTP